MHAAEGFPLFVFADGVEVEPGGAPQEQRAPVAADGSGIAKEAIERRELGPDHQRGALERQRRRDGREPEQVADDDLCLVEDVHPTREPAQIELGREDASVAAEPERALSEAPEGQLDGD